MHRAEISNLSGCDSVQCGAQKTPCANSEGSVKHCLARSMERSAIVLAPERSAVEISRAPQPCFKYQGEFQFFFDHCYTVTIRNPPADPAPPRVVGSQGH